MRKKIGGGGGDGGFIEPYADRVPDLKRLIREGSVFIDHLVELTPARIYLPAPDDKPWFPGLKAADRAAAKLQSRENLKKARRERHDPHRAPPSTLHLLRESLQPPQTSDDDAVRSTAEQPSVTYEELRHRLRRRIEELRAGRTTQPGMNDKKEKKKATSKTKKKRKRGDEAQEEEKKKKKTTAQTKKKRKRGEEAEVEKKSERSKKQKPSIGGDDISFGQVKIGGNDGTERKNKKNKKKISKVQALEKVRRLEEAKKDPEKGEAVAKKHSWSTAASRAAGGKVHDDPKLLKESLKKEKRQQQRHAEKWKERVESRDTAREERQRVRAENIKERIHERKMRRIEKREKKLMRPGFEGRKEGYINA